MASYRWMAVLLLTGGFYTGCADNAAYINPAAEIQGQSGEGSVEKLIVRIKPLYTSGFQSEERDKYQFNFSSYFTAIQVTIQNKTPFSVEWDPSRATLKNGNISYESLNEEAAVNYYRKGGIETGSIVLLERSYELQKEEIDIIKKNMMKPGQILSGQELQGLLIFKKLPVEKCEKLILNISGLKLNQEERSLTFPLACSDN